MIEFSTKKKPVSVILTLFNSRKYFNRAIRSLEKQTFDNFELIIVDDGSEDNIEIDIFKLFDNSIDLKYLKHSNRGHPLSLNSGIMISSGEYITFLDSDDEYSDNHLELRVKYFNENNTDLIFSPAILSGEEKDFYIPDKNNLKEMIHINDCVIGGTIFGKREVFYELNGFNNIYSHDSDLIERAKNMFNVKRLDAPTYIYHRDNPDSVTKKMKSK